MRLHWDDLGTPRADVADGEAVEIVGWPATALPVESADYFLLTAEPNCCAGWLPGNPLAVIAVFANRPLEFAGRGEPPSRSVPRAHRRPLGSASPLPSP